MFDALVDVISSSSWTYLVVFGMAVGDVLFPVIPSETAVITAGVLAASGDLEIWLIIVCAATGACLGDNIAYLIGRSLKDFVHRRVFPEQRRHRLEWAERALQERGGQLIVIGRFIPGGRTAVTVAAGVLDYPWRRFIAFDVLAAAFWGSYAGLIGYFGGRAFEESPLKGILVALGIAFAIAGAIEGIRWLRRRRLGSEGGDLPSSGEAVSSEDQG